MYVEEQTQQSVLMMKGTQRSGCIVGCSHGKRHWVRLTAILAANLLMNVGFILFFHELKRSDIITDEEKVMPSIELTYRRPLT